MDSKVGECILAIVVFIFVLYLILPDGRPALKEKCGQSSSQSVGRRRAPCVSSDVAGTLWLLPLEDDRIQRYETATPTTVGGIRDNVGVFGGKESDSDRTRYNLNGQNLNLYETNFLQTQSRNNEGNEDVRQGKGSVKTSYAISPTSRVNAIQPTLNMLTIMTGGTYLDSKLDRNVKLSHIAFADGYKDNSEPTQQQAQPSLGEVDWKSGTHVGERRAHYTGPIHVVQRYVAQSQGKTNAQESPRLWRTITNDLTGSGHNPKIIVNDRQGGHSVSTTAPVGLDSVEDNAPLAILMRSSVTVVRLASDLGGKFDSKLQQKKGGNDVEALQQHFDARGQKDASDESDSKKNAETTLNSGGNKHVASGTLQSLVFDDRKSESKQPVVQQKYDGGQQIRRVG